MTAASAPVTFGAMFRPVFSRAALALVLVSSAPDLALAQDDVVLLENGGRVRGRVVEHDPDSATTVVLATGETRRIEASAVSEVRFAGEAEAQGAPERRAEADVAADPAEHEPERAFRLRGAGWAAGGTYAGRAEWQGFFLAGGGIELAFAARIQLRAEGVVGWVGPAGSSGVPQSDVARLGGRVSLGVSALEWLELRTFGGAGTWIAFGGSSVGFAGYWELGERVVLHLPPEDHLEVGVELTWHGSMAGVANPFGFGAFLGFVI